MRGPSGLKRSVTTAFDGKWDPNYLFSFFIHAVRSLVAFHLSDALPYCLLLLSAFFGFCFSPIAWTAQPAQ